MMNWIYLSPHLDDVALSLGGLLWEQSTAGEQTTVWTICAGDPTDEPLSAFAESLHTRWETGQEAMVRRRAEDVESCAILGASYQHFSIPDCIYRKSEKTRDYLYTSERSLTGPLHPDEQILVRRLNQTLKTALTSEVNLVCPLGLGNHVDHQLTRAAAEELKASLWFYADYPYCEEISNWETDNLQLYQYYISDKGLRAWQDSVAAHHSQISTFWGDISEMCADILDYARKMGGVKLWKLG